MKAAFARLAELEKVVKEPRGADASLVEALKAQTEAVVEAVKSKSGDWTQSSTIKITPQIRRPVLGDDVGKDDRKRRRTMGSSHLSTQMSRQCDVEGDVSASTSVLRSNHPGPDSIAAEGSWLVENSTLAGGRNDNEMTNTGNRPFLGQRLFRR